MRSGETYQAVATAIGNIVAETYATFEAWASQITVQARQDKTNADEIGRVLADCRAFVQQARDKSLAAKIQLTLEVDAL